MKYFRKRSNFDQSLLSTVHVGLQMLQIGFQAWLTVLVTSTTVWCYGAWSEIAPPRRLGTFSSLRAFGRPVAYLV
jgi:hypothetical protein